MNVIRETVPHRAVYEKTGHLYVLCELPDWAEIPPPSSDIKILMMFLSSIFTPLVNSNRPFPLMEEMRYLVNARPNTFHRVRFAVECLKQQDTSQINYLPVCIQYYRDGATLERTFYMENVPLGLAEFLTGMIKKTKDNTPAEMGKRVLAEIKTIAQGLQ